MIGSASRERLAPFFVLFASALGLWIVVLNAAHRPLWFDEMSTLLVSSQHSVAAYFHVQPVDAQPPLEALLVHFALRLPLPVEIGIRLPSMFGYLVAGWAIYLFVAREGMRMAAAVAASSFLLGAPIYFAFEARPYALLMASTAVVLVCWQRAVWNHGARRWTIALAVAMALLTLSHAFGFLFGMIPVGLAELVRWWRNKRLDAKVALAAITDLLPTLFIVWLSGRTKLLFLSRFHGATSAAAKPSLALLGATFIYCRSVPLTIVLVAAMLCLVLGRRQLAAATVPRKFEEAEWAAVAGVFVAAVVSWGLAMTYTHYYFARYGCACLVAVSILCGMAFSLRGGRVREGIVWLSEIAILLALILAPKINADRRAHTPAENTEAAALGTVPADGEPIVVANALVYQQVQRYAAAVLRPRLVFVTDPAQALRTPDFVPELAVDAYSDLGALQLPVVPYDQFVRDHPAFYVLSDGWAGEWLPEALVRDGFHRTSGPRIGVGRYQR